MPIFGTLDPQERAASAAHVERPAEDSWETDEARELRLTFEIDDTQRLALIPPALHPAIPLYAHLTVRSHGTSPVGAFTLAEIRIMTRAGSHYGGYCIGAFADTEDGVTLLRDGYGWPVTLGEVTLRERYHGAQAIVNVDGRTVLEMALERPEPITPADLLITAGFNLAHVGSDLRLIQSEPHYEIQKVDRGQPSVVTLDTEAFGDARVKITNPVVATYLRGGFQLGKVRYLIDPTRPATEGTVRL